jgi:TolC family type I secretion outer membrane protein
LTLADVTDLALRNNPATRISWAQARAAAATYGSVRGQYLPTIDASASIERTKSLAAQGRPPVQRTQYGPELDMSYLLFDFGARSGATEAARQTVVALGLTHNSVVQNTVLDVSTAYFTYLATQALVDAQTTAVKEAQANVDAAKERHSVGLATIADVLQAQTALSQAQLALETTQGSLQTARGALAVAMGLPANVPYDVTMAPPSIPTHAVAASVDSLIDLAVQRRPDLAAARADALAASAQVRAARGALLPSLALTGNVGHISTIPSSLGGNTYGIGLGVQIPLFSGFSRQYDVLAARAQADVAAARADQVRQTVVNEVFTSYYALQTASQRVATADALLTSAQQSADVASGRYREGVGSIIDLLTAESALADARAQQVQARWQWETALAQLSHDVGILGLHGETPLLADSASASSPSSHP